MNQSLHEYGRKIVQEAPELYIDIDVEADGYAGYGSLLSIGAVTPSGETYYSELRPDSEIYIAGQRQFCEEHGLERERLLAEARSPKTVMQEFANWTNLQREKVGGKKAVFAAFNAGFDHGLVKLEFLKTGIEDPYALAPFDIKSLAQCIRYGWDWNMTAKSNLPSEILPDGDFTHNALEDARYQQKIHFALAGLVSRLGKNQDYAMAALREYV